MKEIEIYISLDKKHCDIVSNSYDLGLFESWEEGCYFPGPSIFETYYSFEVKKKMKK